MRFIVNYLFLAVLMVSVKIAAGQGKGKNNNGGTAPSPAPEANYISALVLPKASNYNSQACSPTESLAIQAQFTYAAEAAAISYPGTVWRRELADENHRALSHCNCANLCQGFPVGQCWLAYPCCYPRRRRLEQETPIGNMDSEGNTENAAAVVPSTSFRGEQRKLTFSEATYNNSTGFFNEASVDAGAEQYCAHLRSKVWEAVNDIASTPGLSQSCENQNPKHYTVGCVWV